MRRCTAAGCTQRLGHGAPSTHHALTYGPAGCLGLSAEWAPCKGSSALHIVEKDAPPSNAHRETAPPHNYTAELHMYTVHRARQHTNSHSTGCAAIYHTGWNRMV